MIPLFQPPTQSVPRMIDELHDTLTGRWWGQGPKVDKFEAAFKEKFGYEHGFMTNSGTAALHLAYRLAGVGKGDQVIVPVLTCTATCHPILLLGGKVVFADIDPDTLCVSPKSIEKHINRKTKAVVTVHLGGNVCNMKELRGICDDAGIPLIEDAAQSIGAQGGAGLGDYVCHSFQAIKHFSTGDGGFLICKDVDKAAKGKRLRWFDIDREQKITRGWQAWDRRGITFDQEDAGYKYQPTDITASIGIAGLPDFDTNYAVRATYAKIYRAGVSNAHGVEMLKDGEDHANWLFMIKVDKRDDFADFMRAREIETNVAHIRNDAFQVFGGRRKDLPGMDSVESKYICLPLHDRLTAENMNTITQAVCDWAGL